MQIPGYAQAMALVRDRIKSFPNLLDAFDATVTWLGPMDDWIGTSLLSAGDSAEPYPVRPLCTKRVAAIRQNNVMYGDPEVISSLAPAQRALLMAHEALYLISNRDESLLTRSLIVALLYASTTTDDLRSKIKALLGDERFAEYMGKGLDLGMIILGPGLATRWFQDGRTEPRYLNLCADPK